MNMKIKTTDKMTIKVIPVVTMEVIKDNKTKEME